MKKCLLLVALLVVSQIDKICAQPLFTLRDTVCVRQKLDLTSTVAAQSYYWGFCSGYLLNTPAGTNLGSSFGFNKPSGVTVQKDNDGNYYGFVIDSSGSNLTRLSYGKSLSNTPVAFSFGTLHSKLPTQLTTLYIVEDTTTKSWFMFVGGGNSVLNSTLGRIDFGTSLGNNNPNVVNFGNYNNLLNIPRGIFVAQEAGNWYGYCINEGNGELIQMVLGNNVSLTPRNTSLGNLGGLFNAPSDMAAIRDAAGNWYFFVVEFTVSQLLRIDMGNTLTTSAPAANSIGNPFGILAQPTSIKVLKDCDSFYAFATNYQTNDVALITMPSIIGPYNAVSEGVVSTLVQPTALSRVIRDHDNLYMFIVDSSNSLTRYAFKQCSSVTPLSSSTRNTGIFEYTKVSKFHPYNIYLLLDEGLPTMQSYCKPVWVEDIPPMTLTDDTTICEGDTIQLVAISPNAYKYIWSPFYGIPDTSGGLLKADPKFSLTYYLAISYNDGCVVDTFVVINVSTVQADAGPDRTLRDGASTVLGGPLTTIGSEYKYTWTPNEYIQNTGIPDAVVTPPYDITYFLKVEEFRDTLKCTAYDTVVVRVDCSDFNVPNAFAPGQNLPGSNRFGILNKQIIKLNYFRVFDRWGNKVFETTNPSDQWDGTVNGTDALSGVYVWDADGYCASGKRFKKSGNVTLLR